MKTQIIFLLIIAALNVTVILVVSTSASDGSSIVPGMNYTTPLNGTTATDLEAQFNSTGMMDNWHGTPFSGIPYIGDTFSSLSNFFNTFRFLIDGVGAMLEWCGSFIPASQAVFTLIAWAIRILSGIMFVLLIIEFISGRELLP